MGIKVNEREFSWGDIKVFILGQYVGGMRAISYNPTRNKEALEASGYDPRAIQKGRRKTEGSLTCLQSELDALNRSAKAAGHHDILDVDVDIIATYSMDGIVITVDRVNNASFTGWTKSMSADNTFMEVELPFIALGVDANIGF